MRCQIPCNSPPATLRRSGLLRLLASSEAGFTIIEVVVSAIMVVSIAGATATALIATNNFSGDQRHRSQADEIAQQDQERMKGMSAKALAVYSYVRNVGPYDGNTYQVTSTGKFLSSTGTSSCASSGVGAAAYVKIRSEVDWIDGAGNPHWASIGRPPVVQESLVTPPTGGTLLANVKDQNNSPLSGVTVNAAGPDNQTAVTDAEGCVVFGAMDTGDYDVTAVKDGYVDPNGVQSSDMPPLSATVSGSGTSFPIGNPVKIGQAGMISAFFKTQFAAGDVRSDQRAPAMSWFNAGMTLGSQKTIVAATGSPLLRTPLNAISTPGPPMTLFPFNNGTSGVYTNNYQVWAGSCDSDQPPANKTYASVGPGSSVTLNDTPAPRILMPALKIRVSYGTTGTYVTPAHIKLTDSCGLTWSPEIRPTDASTGTQGHLKFPGQPYSSSYTVCADYNNRQATATTSNTNFTIATLTDILITSGSTTGTCTGTG